VKEGLGCETAPGCKLICTGLAASCEKRYIGGNLAVSYETRIESGPLGTRSFLLPEPARCRSRQGPEQVSCRNRLCGPVNPK